MDLENLNLFISKAGESEANFILVQICSTVAVWIPWVRDKRKHDFFQPFFVSQGKTWICRHFYAKTLRSIHIFAHKTKLLWKGFSVRSSIWHHSFSQVSQVKL